MKQNLLFNQASALGKRLAMVLTMLLTVGIGQAWAGEATLAFDNTSKRTVFNENQQVWVYSGITFTVNKSNSSTKVNNSTSINPIRIYGSASATIECAHGNITKIEVTCSSNDYADVFKESVGSEATASGSVVTITPTASSTTYSITSFTAQTRVNSITVTYQDAATAFTITAVSNNVSYGTVSLTSTTITAIPETGYRVSTSNPYEVTEGTATVVDNGDNTFSVTPSSDCTITINFEAIPKYTVNWYVNGSKKHSQTEVQGTALTGIPVPTTLDCDGKREFVGWTTHSSYEHATNAPTDLITNTSGLTMPENGANYYAVFAKKETTPGSNISTPYKFEITSNNFNTTSYAANNKEKTTTAKATDGSNATLDVKWTSYQVMKGTGNNSSAMQWQKNAGYIYNSTNLGTINSVTVTSTAGTFTTYYGTTSQPSSGNSGNGKGYFKTSIGDATGYASKIVIAFTLTTSTDPTTEISDYTTQCSTETLVSLDPNGGTGGTPSVTATKGEAMPTLITLPTRTGYTFQGYFTAASDGTQYYNEDGTSAKDWDKTDETFTLYAQWECAAPTNVKITGEYIRFEGDDIVLTVSGDNIATDARYEWKKGDQVINNQTTATLTINNCTISDAGNYTCTVSNGICSASNNYTVKMYRLRGLTDPEDNWTTDFVFAKGENKTATYSTTLNGNSSYQFKVHDGSVYYGNTGANPTMTSDNCTGWTMQESMGNNVTLQTTITGTYIFTLDYTDESNPTISVTYPQKKMVYLNPGPWDVDNAKFAVHTWEGDNGEDIFMEKVDDCDPNRNIYQAEINASHTNIIFVRANPANSDIQQLWDNVWNQTSDLILPTDGKVMYDMTPLYLSPTAWNSDGAWFAAYFYNASGNTWRKMTDNNEDGIYECEKVSGYPNVIFCRMDKNISTFAWESVWNKSGDLTIPTKVNNHYTVPSDNAWNYPGDDGNWSNTGMWTTYTPNYTVTFDANGHGAAPDAQCVAKNSKATTPDAPTETGYTFGGWYKEAGCTNAWNFANDVVTEDITIYAKWTANTNTAYTVKHYQENIDGTYPATPTETDNLTGTTATSVTPAVKDYTGFTAPSTQTVTIAADGSTVVEYKYTRNSYALTWNLAGGEITKAGTTDGSVKFGALLTAPTVTKSGLTFIGWDPVVPATMPAEPVTYTAIWENCIWVETTTIEDGDEIVFIMVDNNTSTSYAMDNKVTSSNPLAIEINTDIFSSGNVPNNIIWDIQKDANGIVFYSKTAANNSIYCTKSYTRVGVNSANTFTLDNGYIQSLSYDDSYLAVATGANIKDWRQYAYSSNNITNQTLKFYKRICVDASNPWYTVTFDAGSGSCDTESLTGTKEDGIILPTATPSDACATDGWIFAGWATTSVTETTTAPTLLRADNIYNPSDNCTLYAVYSKEETNEGGGATSTEATLSFASTAQRTSFSSTQQVWEQNGITLTNTKGAGDDDASVGNYYNPARFYAGSEIIIEALGEIILIEADCSEAKYATALVNSITVGNATADGVNITITPSESSNTYTIASLTNQTRFNSLTVTYLAESGPTITITYNSNPDCATYTLIFNDRGVETSDEYSAGYQVPQPTDPEGVCTEPIEYVFDGWAKAEITAENVTSYEKVTFPFTMPAASTTLYAVYRYVDGEMVATDDFVSCDIDYDGIQSGEEYVITANKDNSYKEYAFTPSIDNGKGSTSELNLTAIDEDGDDADDYYQITTTDNNIIWILEGDEETGYSVKNKQTGTYWNVSGDQLQMGKISTEKFVFYHPSDSWNINIYNETSNKYVAAYSEPVKYNLYEYNTYDIYLYKRKLISSYLYTTSPVCGPHLVVTEGKEIYVTGGNAGEDKVRDVVTAQQKVSYTATRLQTSNGKADGTAPDVKVPTNGITKGGKVTTEVKVTFENTVKEQQTDGTYTITGDIVVTYEPTANNLQEDIQVQLVVDYPTYNSEAKDNFTVHARSLPTEFVIVAKSGDKWYALNADMSGDDAELANGQLIVDDETNPTKATFAPCNAIYTFEGMPQGSDRTFVRFIGTEGKYLWAATAGKTGIQNYSKNPAGDAVAYNWTLHTTDNQTYQFENKHNGRLLGLNGEKKFGMYTNAVQDIRILPFDATCIYNYAPTNLTISVLKSTSVTLTWDPVPSATKYQYSTDATAWTNAGTEPTVTIEGLESATEYTYYIRAYHEEADAMKECIDYAEVTFTTADCDDVPSNITYSADLTTIVVSWTATSATSTVKLYSDKEGSLVVKTAESVSSPYTFNGLAKNTTYYVQIFGGGTCASPIVEVSTKDVEMDVVEWKTDGIVVDVNTNETIGVTLENEVQYGTGAGELAKDLFFSKYFEGSGEMKLVAIYNGTGKSISLEDYTIFKKHANTKSQWSGGDNDKTYDLSSLVKIAAGQEIIFYTKPNADNLKECSEHFFKTVKSGQEDNPRWIECNGEPFAIMDFNGNDALILRKNDTDIDIIGATTTPGKAANCRNQDNEKGWGGTVTNMDYGKSVDDPAFAAFYENSSIDFTSYTEEDKKEFLLLCGINVTDQEIPMTTARCILFRSNKVVEGVATNTGDLFESFIPDQWHGRSVCQTSDMYNAAGLKSDGQATCNSYQDLGTFDYSSYYTKYNPIGEKQDFDESKRNPDGTLNVNIPNLNKQSCRNIQVTITDANDNVLMKGQYKVPIMITTDQATAYTEANKDDNAFYVLQENLATIEVDVDGNEIDRHPLTIEQVREICKTCDVVIRDNATLTKALDDDTYDHPQVNNVMIYEGASLEIPSGADYNYTINSLSLRRKGDIVASAKVEEGGKLHLPASATAPIYLDMRIDANNWHWFTLPYNCNIADVTWVDGTPAQYNKDWFIMYYDGNSRAHEESIYENHWKVYNGTTIEAGKGYIVGIQGDITHPDYTFELRFPMTTEVLTNEHTDKTVAVNAWGVKMDITPNKKGWNLVGNPYLDYYKTSENISFEGLSLIKYEGIDPVTGERLYQKGGNVPFLVTPVDGGWYEYQQELASDVEMMPFTAYFVQVGNPNNPDHTDGMELHAQFESDHRGRMSLIRRAPQEVDGEQEPVIVRVEVANTKGESDKTTLIIDDRFTNEYEMNGDFFKWFGDYYRRYTKPVLYSMGADHGKRAFNALSEQLAAQPVALGMFAAQAGDYTFSLTRKRCDLSRVEEVWLYDATTATYTNLMQQDYTFTTAKTEGEGRFYLSVKMKQKTPTAVENVNGNLSLVAHQQTLVLSGLPAEAQVWVYDATGKLLHSEHTTAYQRIYPVQQAGVYFVSVKGQGDAQTLSTIVK